MHKREHKVTIGHLDGFFGNRNMLPPVYLAILQDHPKVVDTLIQAGVGLVNSGNNSKYRTAVHYAAVLGRLKILEVHLLLFTSLLSNLYYLLCCSFGRPHASGLAI